MLYAVVLGTCEVSIAGLLLTSGALISGGVGICCSACNEIFICPTEDGEFFFFFGRATTPGKILNSNIKGQNSSHTSYSYILEVYVVAGRCVKGIGGWKAEDRMEYGKLLELIQRHRSSLEYGEFLHTVRMELEGPIFDSLRARYGSALQEFWDSASFPEKSANTVMLVERREHPNIEFVLQNVMYFVREHGFSLTVVCSKENEAYVRKILGKHQATTHIWPYFEDNCDRDKAREEYNLAFKNAEFWEQIRAEYILSIQTDCYLRKPLPELVWTVDYVAAPWAWKPWVVGGSGLTFRKKEAVIDMCKEKPKKKMAEDEFFAHMCLRKKVLPLEIAEHIFSESRFVDDPVGVHQWWTYLAQVDIPNETDFFIRHFQSYTTLHV